jgi:hypothetical protein
MDWCIIHSMMKTVLQYILILLALFAFVRLTSNGEQVISTQAECQKVGGQWVQTVKSYNTCKVAK